MEFTRVSLMSVVIMDHAARMNVTAGTKSRTAQDFIVVKTYCRMNGSLFNYSYNSGWSGGLSPF